ncbi:unnamed protein product, partial [Porites lobata]
EISSPVSSPPIFLGYLYQKPNLNSPVLHAPLRKKVVAKFKALILCIRGKVVCFVFGLNSVKNGKKTVSEVPYSNCCDGFVAQSASVKAFPVCIAREAVQCEGKKNCRDA